MSARHVTAPYLTVGGLCGLTWAASLRGWMAELVGDGSSFTWLTVVLVLLPGLVLGLLLGWAAYLRGHDLPAPRWLPLAPALLAVALADPTIFAAFLRDGEGGGSLIVVATSLCSGFVLARHGWSLRRAAGALVAALGLLLLGLMGTMAAPLSTARGAWVCLYGFSLVLLLCLASTLPYPRLRPQAADGSLVALGTLCGVAWACALRAFMAQVAGPASDVHWVDTWAFILLPGAVTGALLGWAEVLRRTGGRHRWRTLALAPLVFTAVLFSDPAHLSGILADGIGGGAIGVPVVGMIGGLAVSGRGPGWARALAGLLFGTALVVWLVTATAVGGQSFALSDPHGLWASVLYETLLVTLALGASVPHRATERDDARPTAGGRRATPTSTTVLR